MTVSDVCPSAVDSGVRPAGGLTSGSIRVSRRPLRERSHSNLLPRVGEGWKEMP
jgi:hypothetical protein